MVVMGSRRARLIVTLQLHLLAWLHFEGGINRGDGDRGGNHVEGTKSRFCGVCDAPGESETSAGF